MGEKISRENAIAASKEYMKTFGWNKNAARVTPGGLDGLKPGKRRAFYAWWETLGKPENPSTNAVNKIKFMKVATIAGNSMRYHPHSTIATESMIGREGQYWNNNVLTITPKGNYGSIRGDRVAASRYIEARPSQYMIDCFFDEFSKFSTPMVPSYDGDSFEPEYFPVKYPHLLFNPQFSGIGYGASSNIPPFNVSEVLKACIKLLRNPDAKIKLIPDIPTKCDIIDTGDFDSINDDGVGKLMMRATYNIDYQNNIIKIRSLPLTVASSDIITKCIELQEAKKLDGIQKFNDSTQDGEVFLDIILKPDTSPDKLMKTLLKKTDLEFTLPVAISVVEDYMIYDYGVKDYLLKWLEFRKNTLISRYNKELQAIHERIHILEILIDITTGSKADEVVKIIRGSNDDVDSIEKLMKLSSRKMTSIQARNILRMAVGKFNKRGHDGFVKELEELQVSVKKVLEYLQNPEALKNLMISQFEDGIRKYGGPRRSRIIGAVENPNITNHIVGVSENGFIKKVSIDDRSIGKIGKSYDPMTVLDAKSDEILTLFTSTGRVQQLKVSDIPEMSYDDIGIELQKFSNLDGRVISVIKNMPLGTSEILIVTKFGLAKRLTTKELGKIDNNKKDFITLNPGDEVVSVIFSPTHLKTQVLIYTNIGNGVRLAPDSIKTLGKSAKGTRQIALREDEVVTGASLLVPTKKLVFYITSSGRCKVTESKLLPTLERASNSISLINMDKNETLVGICSVDNNDVVLGFKRTGEPTRIDISSLTPTSRMSKGEKKIKTPKGDFVVGYKLFS